MHPLLVAARAVLDQHPAPALRLAELARQLQERGHPTAQSERLLRLLTCEPDRFRLLWVWTGPASRPAARPSLRTRARVGVKARVRELDTAGDGRETWVVALDPADEPAPPGRARHGLRESVRWMARRVDPRSARAVSRWYRMVLAEREARRGLRPPAA